MINYLIIHTMLGGGSDLVKNWQKLAKHYNCI